MIVKNNILFKIDDEDIIDGVFTATEDVLYIDNYLDCGNVEKLILPNVISIGKYCMIYNKSLVYIEMPKVENIGYDFLYWNDKLHDIYMPNIKEIRDGFLLKNSIFNYTPMIIKALRDNLYIGGERVDKKEYLRKLNIKKILC